jgi:hypothetical protein
VQHANAAQAKLMPISAGIKRPKVDKEGLEKFLFMCFEREKHWHFKDLVVRPPSLHHHHPYLAVPVE